MTKQVTKRGFCVEGAQRFPRSEVREVTWQRDLKNGPEERKSIIARRNWSNLVSRLSTSTPCLTNDPGLAGERGQAIPDGGNCLFRSLSKQLCNDADNHSTLSLSESCNRFYRIEYRTTPWLNNPEHVYRLPSTVYRLPSTMSTWRE